MTHWTRARSASRSSSESCAVETGARTSTLTLLLRRESKPLRCSSELDPTIAIGTIGVAV